MASAFENLAPRVISDLIKDFQLTPAQAAGIIGNLNAESGVRAIPEQGGGGFGWAQWTGPRRTAFLQWCQKCHFDSESYEANYGYLREELSGTFPNYNYSYVITKLRQAKTPEEAAEIFCNTYERPAAATAHMTFRKTSAQQALLLYLRAKAGVPAQSPAPPSPKGQSPMDPNSDSKPWYLSKGVIGGAIAVIFPILGFIFPGLKGLANLQGPAADVIQKILEIFGPVVGGIVAIIGRISATQPISGTKAAKDNNFVGTDSAGNLSVFGLPLGTVLSEIPIIISSLSSLNTEMASAKSTSEKAPP